MSDSPGLPPHDTPPHDTFDQIADVFLTEPLEMSDSRSGADVGDPAGTLTKSPCSSAIDSRGINPWTAPLLSLAGGPLESASSSEPFSESGTAEVLLAANPLVEDCEVAETKFGEILPPHTSILFACHLPVQGRLWLNQIADLVARRHGPTCFVRIDSARMVSAELLATAGEESVPELHQSSRTLAEAIRPVAAQVEHYLIHVERLAEIAALTEAREPAPARIILATSVDPAALVGVYRTLKELVPVLHVDTEIDLVLVGAAPEAAKAAFGRIASATTGFLKRTIGLQGILQRINPIVMVHLGDFEPRSPVSAVSGKAEESLVSWVCNEIGAGFDTTVVNAGTSSRTVSAPPAEPPVPVTPVVPLVPRQPVRPRLAEISPAAVSAPVVVTTIPVPLPNPFQVTSTAPMTPNAPASPPPSSLSSASATPVAAGSTAGSASVPNAVSASDLVESCPKLSSLIPGLVDLVARSPKGPAVELAVDRRGNIHALYQDSADESPHAAVAQLQSVCEWIENNAEMLTLLRTYPVVVDSAVCASPLSQPALPSSPQAHLFTDQPQKYRALMDGSLLIHLLARNCDVVVKNQTETELFEQERAADPSWIQVPIN